jgi:hypothetical protein
VVKYNRDLQVELVKKDGERRSAGEGRCKEKN